MITLIPDVLTAEELRVIRPGLGAAPYIDGAKSAGGAAREVKKNRQIALDNRKYEQLAGIVRDALLRNDRLRAALLPAVFTRVLFNRYDQGMEYGPHVDAPLMGPMGNMLRADVAITLFISDPDSYDGGELVARPGSIEHRFKHQAGTAVAYPANTLHHVTPVTRGTRDAAIVWVQSMVRDPAKRELLWDLDTAERDLYQREGRSPTFEAVNRSHVNLLRMWADI